MSVRADAAALQDDLRAFRARLHRIPELGLDLPRTQAAVLAELDGLPLTVTTGSRLSSVTAVLRGPRPGPTVLLRGDMDALPVTENGSPGWVSAVPGRMHACGHDLHTAMLTGAARLLAARRDRLAGDVIFMFQPGEEGRRGARIMMDEGVLEATGNRPAAAYALHVFASTVPTGTFLTRSGPIMAAADRLAVTVRGAGGHAAQPHRALDPVPAACEMVLALQAMVTRGFDVFDPVVVTVGSFHAGTADNIIPETAHFEVTIRTFSAQNRARVQDRSVRLVRGIAEAHGLRAEADYEINYPVTVNDDAETGFAADTIRDVYGEERFVDWPSPFAGAEDFAFLGAEIPSAYVILGACPADRDPARAPSNHAPQAAFDDAVLADGAALYAELALRRLRLGDHSARNDPLLLNRPPSEHEENARLGRTRGRTAVRPLRIRAVPSASASASAESGRAGGGGHHRGSPAAGGRGHGRGLCDGPVRNPVCGLGARSVPALQDHCSGRWVAEPVRCEQRQHRPHGRGSPLGDLAALLLRDLALPTE